MPDQQEAAEIRAAGAVLWRPVGSGSRVALIHRPKYDDLSLAKGKVDPDEHVLLAAVREVWEETGLHIDLGVPLPPTRYLVDGQAKRVDYWAAQVGPSAGEFVPNNEVDRLDWVALSRAGQLLSYRHDAELLGTFAAAPRPTMPLILVRHASAGSKSDWRNDDALRPLDARGKLQAKTLGQLLACFGRGRVLSSPAERCMATLRPYAQVIGTQVEAEPAFGLPTGGTGKKAERAAADALAQAAGQAARSAATTGAPVVICAHRENLPLLLAAACDRLGAPAPTGPPLRKGEFLVLHRAHGTLAATERHHPEGSQLPAEFRRDVGELD